MSGENVELIRGCYVAADPLSLTDRIRDGRIVRFKVCTDRDEALRAVGLEV